MQGRVQVRIHSPTTGALQAVLVEWRTLNLERQLNHWSNMSFSLRGDDLNIQYFVTDALIAVWRSVENGTWYLEDILLHRTSQHQQTEMGTLIFTSYSRGLLDLLRRRQILYNAGSAFAEKSGAGETVMKAYVDQNAGPAASHASRKANGVTTGLTIAADTALGATWSGEKAWQNLAEVLDDIADPTGVDFDVVPLNNDVPITFEFRTYFPQRGVDRTAQVPPVLFGNIYANMIDPSYTISRTEEVNRVAVLGQGQESRRRVVIRENTTAMADSPWNTAETTADGRNSNAVAQLNSVGDEILEHRQTEKSFTFSVLQSGPFLYGREYGYGDVVYAQFGTIRETLKIVGVTLNITEGRERVGLKFSNISTQ